MSTPEITAIRLSGEGEDTPDKDVLFVGAGLGTGVQALWAEAATELADRFQVIGWDLPGHGQSPAHNEPTSIADLANAVADLVRAQHTAGTIPAGSKVYYAGVSVNGEVALQLGLDHGELFDGIAVICSGAKIGQPQAWLERAEFVEKSGTPSQVAGSAERWFAPGFIEKHPNRSTRLLHTLQEADRFSYARVCEALAGFDVRERLGEITTPILAINGDADQVCPPASGEEIAAGVTEGTAVVLEGVAHQAPTEDPEGTARIIKEHFGAVRARHHPCRTGASMSENPQPIGHDMSATSQDVFDAGMAVRREVLGNAHVDRAESKKDETTEDFQNLITRYAWGTIWTRPGLDRRMRSAVTISAMVSGGYWEEAAMHIRAALRNGLSRDEIKEILLQTAIYSSVPAANIAFKLAQDVFAQVDEDLAAGKEL